MVETPTVGEIKLPIGVQDSDGYWHVIGEIGVPVRIASVEIQAERGEADVTLSPDGEKFVVDVESFLAEPTTVERISEAISRQYRTPPAR